MAAGGAPSTRLQYTRGARHARTEQGTGLGGRSGGRRDGHRREGQYPPWRPQPCSQGQSRSERQHPLWRSRAPSSSMCSRGTPDECSHARRRHHPGRALPSRSGKARVQWVLRRRMVSTTGRVATMQQEGPPLHSRQVVVSFAAALPLVQPPPEAAPQAKGRGESRVCLPPYFPYAQRRPAARRST